MHTGKSALSQLLKNFIFLLRKRKNRRKIHSLKFTRNAGAYIHSQHSKTQSWQLRTSICSPMLKLICDIFTFNFIEFIFFTLFHSFIVANLRRKSNKLNYVFILTNVPTCKQMITLNKRTLHLTEMPKHKHIKLMTPRRRWKRETRFLPVFWIIKWRR